MKKWGLSQRKNRDCALFFRAPVCLKIGRCPIFPKEKRTTMFNIYRLLNTPYGFYDYIWIDCILIKETRKAILIMFDDQKIWLPKAWIIKTVGAAFRPRKTISIKISLYHWARKA